MCVEVFYWFSTIFWHDKDKFLVYLSGVMKLRHLRYELAFHCVLIMEWDDFFFNVDVCVCVYCLIRFYDVGGTRGDDDFSLGGRYYIDYVFMGR